MRDLCAQLKTSKAVLLQLPACPSTVLRIHFPALLITWVNGPLFFGSDSDSLFNFSSSFRRFFSLLFSPDIHGKSPRSNDGSNISHHSSNVNHDRST
uniref:Uncharacterized protein n=1 Tax=Escherichia coli TaxID=562 RepID=A0A3G4RXF4_ECOLX|nr:hypothetical protein D0362_00200 [Escherichia coli]